MSEFEPVGDHFAMRRVIGEDGPGKEELLETLMIAVLSLMVAHKLDSFEYDPTGLDVGRKIRIGWHDGVLHLTLTELEEGTIQ